MELYNSFGDKSYSTYSKFYSFKEIFLSDISLIPSCPISKTRLIQRVFARNEQILQKEALFCPVKRIFVFKIYFYKSFINM